MGATMEPFRLRLKVGAHEFEAAGEEEAVERLLAVWRELIASSPVTLASPPPSSNGAVAPTVEPAMSGNASSASKFGKVFKHESRIVSLILKPSGDKRNADAALLILLGQRLYNGVELVTGGMILDGLKQSGITEVERANWVLGEYIPGFVLEAGARRGKTYRLTNPGMAKAEELAQALERMVP
jgi:hypothetical protein